jgi:long-chain fatty acid transport protein
MRLIYRNRLSRLAAAIVVLILTTFSSSFVHAGGPAFSRLFGAAEDAVTAMTNPAGMTRIEKTQLLTQGILAVNFSRFDVDENRTTTDGGDPRDPAVAAIPSIYYVRPMGEDWRLGLSFSVPAGFGATNGPNWAGRYYSDEFSLVFFALNAMVAYPVTDWLSLGGGISGIYSSAESKTRVPNPGVNASEAKIEMDA